MSYRVGTPMDDIIVDMEERITGLERILAHTAPSEAPRKRDFIERALLAHVRAQG